MMLKDKVVLITGSSSGIGLSIAKTAAAAGAKVMLHGTRENLLVEAVASIGKTASYIACDLGRADAGEIIVKATVEEFGRLDGLVNNAGISPKAEDGGRLNSIETDLRTWGHVFHVNFFAAVVLARGLIKELEAGKGSVINVTSIAGARVHPFAGTAYATSKAALAALTREMAHDFGPIGVRVNAVAPGEIATEILSPGTEEMAASLPLRRLGRPEEVAQTIYYLASPESSYVSGVEIEINGAQHV
mgnify:CR=1 FL=1